MNVGNKLAIIFTFVSALAIVLCFLIMDSEDKVPPIITFSANAVVYTENMNRDMLLESVSAIDDKDGDVTDSIVIEKVTRTSDGNAVIVTYAARDHSNNFVKSSRIFEAAWNKKQEVQSRKIEKVQKEELAGEEKESEESEENTAEEKNTDEEVTDEIREEEDNHVVQEETQVKQAPVLLLNTSDAVLHRGDSFNINDYIAQLSDNADTLETLQHKIQTNGEFDNNTAGDYQVTVLVTDSEGNQSEAQQLTIHVVE